MKTESDWKYDAEKKAFICGAMSAEIDDRKISIYVMGKRFLEFGDVDKLSDFSKLLQSLANCIE